MFDPVIEHLKDFNRDMIRHRSIVAILVVADTVIWLGVVALVYLWLRH